MKSKHKTNVDLTTITIRPKQTFPAHSELQDTIAIHCPYRIRILHPGYTEPQNTLFLLPAPDHPQGGFHHETILTASGIIAGNRWDGFLSMTKRPDRIELPLDGILRHQKYYFHVPGFDEEDPYPVVPTFREWLFPHDNLPPSWNALQTFEFFPETAVRARDGICRMSCYKLALQVAHLCPMSEQCWFIDNSMWEYSPRADRMGAIAVDNPANALLLRQDLHNLFDDRHFTFVPKKGQLVIHCFIPSPEIHIPYHNFLLHPWAGVSVQYLFVRFAMTIFPYFSHFLERKQDTKLLIGNKVEMMEASLVNLYLHKTSKNSSRNSPTKRQRPDTNLELLNESDDYNNWTHKRQRRDSSSTISSQQATEPSSSRFPVKSIPPQVHLPKSVISPEGSSYPRAHSVDIPKLAPKPLLVDSSSPPNSDSEIVKSPRPLADSLAHSLREYKRIARLQRQYLSTERARSDPEGTWTKEIEWAQNVFDRPLTQAEVARWRKYCGAEYLDEDEDEDEDEAVHHES
ncbi:MAG: hypothetical protein M1834_006562 [Cirrosporium novae-zelandiae]|nr:MAG: hypothetical protein M1834_006562 [Cirrosporium novae-zelandiae]